MKKITVFILTHCPHCIGAKNYINELFEENSKYKEIEFEYIDEEEQSELAEKYDYYYVPTFYVDGEKCHEGVNDKAKIKAVLDYALK